MRRLLAINLTVVLFAPWIAGLSGSAVPVVPCPMHRSGAATSHDHLGVVARHGKGVEHDSHSTHGTSAEGCNCIGECGRSGKVFTLPAKVLLSVQAIAVSEPLARQRYDFVSAIRLLPDATGPPQRLLI